VLPLIMVGLGVAIIVRTLAEGGGAGAVGLLLGVLFCLAGGLRLWFERRAPR
jgi:Zn-dependent protease with chaperone function